MTRFLWHRETGERIEIGDGDKAPEGFITMHPGDPAAEGEKHAQKPAGAPADKYPEMKKTDIAAALSNANIEFDPTAKKSVMGDLLKERLCAHLESQNVEFDKDAGLNDLLGMVAA